MRKHNRGAKARRGDHGTEASTQRDRTSLDRSGVTSQALEQLMSVGLVEIVGTNDRGEALYACTALPRDEVERRMALLELSSSGSRQLDG